MSGGYEPSPSPGSIYDGADDDEPGADLGRRRWLRPPRRTLTREADAWGEAAATSAAGLAEAAAALARLDEALRRTPLGSGAVDRLAILEAATLLHADGETVRIEHVALARVDAPPSSPQAVRGAWIAGRLAAAGTTTALAAFERAARAGEGSPAAAGAEPKRESAGLGPDILAALDGAPALVRAAAAFTAWRAARGPAEIAEAGLLAARVSAEGLRAASFAPLAIGAGRALGLVRGPDRLPTFLEAAREGADRARAHLERLEDWRAAMSAGKGASGARRASMAAHLAATPATSASLAGAATGVSTRTAERLLAALETEGFVREITGQARWRFWAARA